MNPQEKSTYQSVGGCASVTMPIKPAMITAAPKSTATTTYVRAFARGVTPDRLIHTDSQGTGSAALPHRTWLGSPAKHEQRARKYDSARNAYASPGARQPASVSNASRDEQHDSRPTEPDLHGQHGEGTKPTGGHVQFGGLDSLTLRAFGQPHRERDPRKPLPDGGTENNGSHHQRPLRLLSSREHHEETAQRRADAAGPQTLTLQLMRVGSSHPPKLADTSLSGPSERFVSCRSRHRYRPPTWQRQSGLPRSSCAPTSATSARRTR